MGEHDPTDTQHQPPAEQAASPQPEPPGDQPTTPAESPTAPALWRLAGETPIAPAAPPIASKGTPATSGVQPVQADRPEGAQTLPAISGATQQGGSVLGQQAPTPTQQPTAPQLPQTSSSGQQQIPYHPVYPPYPAYSYPGYPVRPGSGAVAQPGAPGAPYAAPQGAYPAYPYPSSYPPVTPASGVSGAVVPPQPQARPGQYPYPPYPQHYPPQYPYPPYPQHYPPQYPQPGQPAYPVYPVYPSYPYPYPQPGYPYPYPYPYGAQPLPPAPKPPKPPKPPRKPINKKPFIYSGAGLVALLILSLISLVIYSFASGTGIRLGPVTIGPTEQINGVVYGQDIHAFLQGRFAASPLAATITCGGVSAQANGHGAFMVMAPAAKQEHCVASDNDYAPVAVTVAGDGSHPLTINFGPAQTRTCSAKASHSYTCALLMLAPSLLHGSVVDAATGQPIPGATVTCWNDGPSVDNSQTDAHTYSTTADANGSYTLRNLPPDRYACIGNAEGGLNRVTIGPGQSVQLNIALCTSNCPGVSYHGGSVMHTMTVYLDFWLPAGYHYEPSGSDARFERLIEQYFKDVGGTSFYGLLTQYWDLSGPVRNSVTLSGVYTDTTPYPHAGTNSDPITDSDVQASIQRAISAAHWNDDGIHDEVFVFTGYGIQECTGGFENGCSFQQSGNSNSFCAYHTTSNFGTIYAYAPDVPDCNYLPTFDAGRVPYGDQIVSAITSAVSHEQFESVTDPNGDGWFTDKQNGGEIGDLCYTSFGFTNEQGGTVTLAHGHSYALQEEWSNAANACAYS